ncbi:MAG: hypothetical protein KDD62_14395, partial [Bdellovibrionales bacterium]|nr:hypothetical protein [Bdellovibrionales bacterium]
VQEHALATWEGGSDLYGRVSADSQISEHLAADDLAAVFDLKTHFKHVDMMFERAKNLHKNS